MIGSGPAGLFEVAAFFTLFCAWVAGEAWIQWRRRLPRDAASSDRGSMIVLIGSVWAAVMLGLGSTVLAPATAIRTGRTAFVAAGLALMLIGMLVRWAAVAALGPSFTVTVGTRAGQPLHDRGLYRLIRHPSYSGSLLIVLGVLCCCANLVALAAFLLPAAGHAYRIRVEERALATGLGEPYRAYMRRTKRLIPFLL